jgi:dihydrofolate reductase
MAYTGQIGRLTSIVAIDRNGAIGCRNALPWKLKTDMAFFKSTTMNHSVLMGRKTFDSIGKKPLPNRKNIVLSHNGLLFDSTVDCCLALSVPESLAIATQSRSREIYVIGGAATYSEFAPLVDRYLVTVVDHIAEDADSFLAEEIRREFEGWDSVEIASYAPTPGQDQYGFNI